MFFGEIRGLVHKPRNLISFRWWACYLSLYVYQNFLQHILTILIWRTQEHIVCHGHVLMSAKIMAICGLFEFNFYVEFYFFLDFVVAFFSVHLMPLLWWNPDEYRKSMRCHLYNQHRIEFQQQLKNTTKNTKAVRERETDREW